MFTAEGEKNNNNRVTIENNSVRNPKSYHSIQPQVFLSYLMPN